MTLGEVCILNRALDGKDIHSMPGFAILDMSGIAASKYKNSLIGKGLLETHSSFTEKGLQTTKLIRDYKNAKKYITVMGFVLGTVDDSSAVALSRDDNGYAFTLVDIEGSVKQLGGAYKFLSLDAPYEVEECPFWFDEVIQMYKPDIDNSFSIMTEKGNDVTHEAFFTDGESILVYDFKRKMLRQMGSGSVKELLMERMVV